MFVCGCCCSILQHVHMSDPLILESGQMFMPNRRRFYPDIHMMSVGMTNTSTTSEYFSDRELWPEQRNVLEI